MKRLSDFVPDAINPPTTLAGIDPGVGGILHNVVLDYSLTHKRLGEVELSRRVEAGRRAVAELVAKCESPIEKMIVPALVFQTYGHGDRWEPALIATEGRHKRAPVEIAAQVTMYDSRFDFLMFVDHGRFDLMIAVECDGREFHDPTRDYYRDRNWRRSGIHTVRLTGSDIHRDPRMAASRVSDFVFQQMMSRGLA